MKKGNVLKKGLNEQEALGQKMPRDEVKGSQKPKSKTEKISGNGKTFKIGC